ncbi:muconolactone Delta-isomerase family protein [Amycolatopsis sp. FDAARGOS 1241]|uniref:muconolactone Delta-isomerase family protein n=1 Tax=Amycolatopsis sp. FDAARGOS 1241 TaxID=2778070 RepID=UPI001EF33D37|nr:muconolactone Delta-isomerase family protein [Amycolatopsis sp. FDAARGOS 1241]
MPFEFPEPEPATQQMFATIGELRSVGLGRADDEADLRRNVLGTLPLHDWMTLAVTPLEPHPNDPGRRA